MQHFVPMINDIAVKWSFIVFQINWQASLVAARLLAVVLSARGWSSPLRYCLLVLALIKFALPPLLPLPTGLFSQMAPAIHAMPAEAEAKAASIVAADPSMKDSPSELRRDTTESFLPEQALQESTPVMARLVPVPVLNSKSWFMLLHLSGTRRGFMADKIQFPTGPEGQQCFPTKRQEVAIFDVGLPGIDGQAVARAFRVEALVQANFLITLTEHGQRQDREAAIQAGFHAHLTKPADLKQLKKMLAMRLVRIGQP